MSKTISFSQVSPFDIGVEGFSISKFKLKTIIDTKYNLFLQFSSFTKLK